MKNGKLYRMSWIDYLPKPIYLIVWSIREYVKSYGCRFR